MKLLTLIKQSNAFANNAARDYSVGLPTHALLELVSLRELLDAQPELGGDNTLRPSKPRKETK